MLKLRKIAITGGVASGKTSVCRFFQELGAFAVNSDAIVHELLSSSTDLGREIIREFGPSILQDGKIDRRLIAKMAFENPKELEKLEKLLHPAVLQRIEDLYEMARGKGTFTLFVVEIPLLFEIKGESFYDSVVTVLADEEMARKRFQKQGFNPEEYDRRMRRQLTPKQKAIQSQFIIHNNGSLDDLKKEVEKLNQKLMSVSQ